MLTLRAYKESLRSFVSANLDFEVLQNQQIGWDTLLNVRDEFCSTMGRVRSDLIAFSVRLSVACFSRRVPPQEASWIRVLLHRAIELVSHMCCFWVVAGAVAVAGSQRHAAALGALDIAGGLMRAQLPESQSHAEQGLR